MTVSSATNRKTFTGDNVTTSFATSPMVFFTTAELLVYVTDNTTGVATLLTENTHYSASGGNSPSSPAVGTVSLAGGSAPHGALLTGTTLTIARDLAVTQGVDFVNNDGADAEVAEGTFDKLTVLIQELVEGFGRVLRIGVADLEGTAAQLPNSVDRASKLLGFSSTGVPMVYSIASSVLTPPRTGTSATDTITSADTSFIANRAGTITLTLEAASSVSGRVLYVRTIQNQTVVSATTNVVPLVGGSAGTAILSGTAGKWAILQSDGTNWQVTAGN